MTNAPLNNDTLVGHYPEGAGLEAVERLSRDIRDAASLLSPAEARYLVSTYYEVQEQRIRANAQVRAANESGEPNRILEWAADQYQAAENNARRALQAFAEDKTVGLWSLSITGVGPVIAAGLLAHIDIEKAPSAGHIWRFAGLDPTVKWERGQKRPWNTQLKVLCWKLGDSFVKTSTREREVYGTIYRMRKELEVARNEAGAFAEQAAASLAAKKYGADTVARQRYEAGKLPDARLHLRAQRYAVKLFLSHWHHVAYMDRYGTPPPEPYVMTLCGVCARPVLDVVHAGGHEFVRGHVDFMSPPNWPMA